MPHQEWAKVKNKTKGGKLPIVFNNHIHVIIQYYTKHKILSGCKQPPQTQARVNTQNLFNFYDATVYGEI